MIAREASLRTKTYARQVQGITPQTSEQLNGQAIANLSWALSTLNHCNGLMENFVPYVVSLCRAETGTQPTISSIAKVFDRRALANLVWACTIEEGAYPKDLIDLLFLGLLGVGECSDPSHLCEVHRDAGIDERAILPVLYLQIAMHLHMKKTTDICFSDSLLSLLPLNFPAIWYTTERFKERTDNSAGIHNDRNAVEFGLTMNTSKMQRDVSDAFTRIGFAHIEEHAITMESLAQDHNIRMAPNPMGVLSLDIANVDAMIGVELDGPSHFLSIIDLPERDTMDEEEDDQRFKYIFGPREKPFEVDGPTILKRRLLEGLGWKVFNIPYWEWESLQEDLVLEEEYCREILSQVEPSRW